MSATAAADDGKVNGRSYPTFAFPPSSPLNTTQFLIERSESRLPSEDIAMFGLGLTNSYGSMEQLMDNSTTDSCRLTAFPIVATN